MESTFNLLKFMNSRKGYTRNGNLVEFIALCNNNSKMLVKVHWHVGLPEIVKYNINGHKYGSMNNLEDIV